MKIKVKYDRFKKVWGYAEPDLNTVFIDNRAKGKKHLEILIHECAHILWPDETEESIVRKSVILTKTLWDENYRRIDDTNTEPLQDGSI